MNARAQLPDLSHLWMPFTANKQFKAQPRLLAGAKGMYYTSADGRQILDGTAGLWCVNAGHCREEIVSAIAKQAGEMDYAPGFQLGHPLAFEAATAVAGLMPAGLDRVFFTNSGSESVDTALKIALAYHRARGEGQRTRRSAASAAITEWASAASRWAASRPTARPSPAPCCRRWTICRTPTTWKRTPIPGPAGLGRAPGRRTRTHHRAA